MISVSCTEVFAWYDENVLIYVDAFSLDNYLGTVVVVAHQEMQFVAFSACAPLEPTIYRSAQSSSRQ